MLDSSILRNPLKCTYDVWKPALGFRYGNIINYIIIINAFVEDWLKAELSKADG